MASFANTAEGGSNNTEVTTANSGGVSGNAYTAVVRTNASNLQYAAAAALHGSLGIAMVCAATESANVGWNTFSDLSIVQRVYIAITAAPTANTQIMAVRTNAAVVAGVSINTTGQLFIQNAASAILATALSALTNASYYRLEFAVTAGTTTTNGYINFAYYLGDSTTAIWTYTSAAINSGTATLTLARVGKMTASSVMTLYLDDYAAQDGAVTFLGPSVAPGGTLLANTAEGGTVSTEVTTANSGGASGNAFSQVVRTAANNLQYATGAMHGTRAITMICASSETASVGWNTFSSNSIVQRLYFKITAAPTTNTQIMAVRNNTAVMAGVALTTAGQLFIQNAASTTLATAPTALSNNTYYRLEMSVVVGTTTSNGTISVAYYLGDATTALWTYTTGGTNTGTEVLTLARVGKMSSSSALALTIDDYAAQEGTTTLLGPSAVTPLAGPEMYSYVSGQWVGTSLYTYSGGQWVLVA